MAEHNWEDKDIDYMLGVLLPCNSSAQFSRACVIVSQNIGRGAQTDHLGRVGADYVRRLLWGLAVGARACAQPAALARGWLPWTYVDQWVIAKHCYAKTEERNKRANLSSITAHEHLGWVLRRHVAEVKEMVHKLGPAKGRLGLLG